MLFRHKQATMASPLTVLWKACLTLWSPTGGRLTWYLDAVFVSFLQYHFCPLLYEQSSIHGHLRNSGACYWKIRETSGSVLQGHLSRPISVLVAVTPGPHWKQWESVPPVWTSESSLDVFLNTMFLLRIPGSSSLALSLHIPFQSKNQFFSITFPLSYYPFKSNIYKN